MKCKAQVTLFLVLGLFIIGSVGLTLFLVSSLSQSNSQDNTFSAQESYSSALVFIRNCLKTSAEDSFYEAFIQGGSFSSQDGVRFSADFLSNDVFVSYGITAVSTPSPTIPLRTGSNSRTYDSIFDSGLASTLRRVGGIVTLAPLCDLDGANNPLNQNRLFTCNQNLYGVTHSSLQYKLSNDITRRMNTCVESGGLSVTFPKNVTISFSDESVFLEQELLVTLAPLNASIEKIAVELPIRIKELYTFLYYVLQKDVNDILFNKQLDYNKVVGCSFEGVGSCLRNGFQLKVHKGTASDVVEVIDERSFLKGEPLRILAAIANRRPIIDSVSENTWENFPTNPRLNIDKSKYDLYRKYTDQIIFMPKVYDFDEDLVIVRYEGWAGTTYTPFNIRAHCSSYDDTNPAGCSYEQLVQGSSTGYNEWEQSSAYRTTSICSQTSLCAHRQLSAQDMGVHDIKIVVTDNRGGSDSYTARLLVGDEGVVRQAVLPVSPPAQSQSPAVVAESASPSPSAYVAPQYIYESLHTKQIKLNSKNVFSLVYENSGKPLIVNPTQFLNTIVSDFDILQKYPDASHSLTDQNNYVIFCNHVYAVELAANAGDFLDKSSQGLRFIVPKQGNTLTLEYEYFAYNPTTKELLEAVPSSNLLWQGYYQSTTQPQVSSIAEQTSLTNTYLVPMSSIQTELIGEREFGSFYLKVFDTTGNFDHCGEMRVYFEYE